MRHLADLSLGALAVALGGAVGCTGTITDTAGDPAAAGTAGSAVNAASGGSGTTTGGSTGTGTGGSANDGSGTGGSSGSSGGNGSSATGGGGTSGSSGTGGAGGSSTAVDCGAATHGGVAPLRRLTQDEYENAVGDLFAVTASDKYPGGAGDPVTGYSTEPDLLLVGEQSVASIMAAAEEVAQSLGPELAKVLPCATKGDDACAGTFLDTIGHRAFRRALTDDERQSLLDTYTAERTDAASFSDAVAVMTAQMLQMPAFLYVLEGDVASGKDRLRTGSELAARLALELWGSVPDAELLDAAEQGSLAKKADVRAQAERLLQDPRADRGFRRFFREWSETSETAVTSKDRGAFPYLDDELSAAINDSFDRFVSDQVRSGGTLYTLLRANTVFVNDQLADFFGLDPVGDWTSVALPTDRYTGISTQPALLAAHAHTVSSSYVFRGRFVMKRLLCLDLGKPPANAQSAFGAIEKPVDPTGKETAAAVEARADCGGCHQVIDPSGLSFEHFDGLGHWRDQYDSGKAIDTSGALSGVTAQPLEFESPVDLMEQLAALPETSQCFATQLFRYTTARLDDSNDSCSIQQIAGSLTGPSGTLESAFIESTQTDGFLYRRGE